MLPAVVTGYRIIIITGKPYSSQQQGWPSTNACCINRHTCDAPNPAPSGSAGQDACEAVHLGPCEAFYLGPRAAICASAGSNGFQLAPRPNTQLNGGSGSTATTPVAANSYVECTGLSTSNGWVCSQRNSTGSTTLGPASNSNNSGKRRRLASASPDGGMLHVGSDRCCQARLCSLPNLGQPEIALLAAGVAQHLRWPSLLG